MKVNNSIIIILLLTIITLATCLLLYCNRTSSQTQQSPKQNPKQALKQAPDKQLNIVTIISEDGSEKTVERKPATKLVVPSGGKYIQPMTFEIGLIRDRAMPISSNVADPNILYPLNGLEPDYGWKMPDYQDCPCTQFIQAP